MYTFDGRVRFSEVDSDGKLTLSSLLNYFQDCSTFQSEDLSVGVDYLKERHMVWVLSSWQIVVDSYPKLAEFIRVGTLPYELKGCLGHRNFWMEDKEGNYFAKANSLWTLLDTRNNRPVSADELMKERYVVGSKLEMDYAPRKIAIPEGGRELESIVVKKHNLDTNHHVNNGQYIDMAMEYLPDGFRIRQMRAEYKMQAFLDDILYPYVAENDCTCTVALRDEQKKPYVVVEFLKVG